MNPNWNNISHEVSALVENVLRTRLLYLEDRYIGHLSTDIGFEVADVLCSRNYIVDHPVNTPLSTTGFRVPSHCTITAGTMTNASVSDASLTASTSSGQHIQHSQSPQIPSPRTPESIRTLQRDEQQRAAQ